MFDVDVRMLDRRGPVRAADVPDADVVVATWWETAEWVAGFPASRGAKAYFVQDHEVFPHLPVERAEAAYRLPFHKIVVSRWLADLVRTQYGDPHASYVPYGVDHGQFHAPPRGKNPTPTVGLVYTKAPRKTIGVALEAYELAAARIPGLRLVAFGAHDVLPQIPLPAGTEFHLRPPQDRLRELYASCDAWLFSTRTEGFGLPILEAMACRTPVIGTPGGAAPELIGEGGGVLVPHGDPGAMARAIEQVVGLDEPSWRRLSDLAHATACRHDWEAAADRFEAALHDAAGRHAAAAGRHALALAAR
jgi:glycosyltransferase involved in cell wall biosynthesis